MQRRSRPISIASIHLTLYFIACSLSFLYLITFTVPQFHHHHTHIPLFFYSSLSTALHLLSILYPSVCFSFLLFAPTYLTSSSPVYHFMTFISHSCLDVCFLSFLVQLILSSFFFNVSLVLFLILFTIRHVLFHQQNPDSNQQMYVAF